MKGLILLALSLVLGVSSCDNNGTPSAHRTTLLLDITTETPARIDLDTATVSDWLVPDDDQAAAHFELGHITDFHQNALSKADLEASDFMANKLMRKAHQRAFHNQCIALLVDGFKAERGKGQSIIFQQIANAINRHTANKLRGKNSIYVMSDLMEHSERYFSFYDEPTLQRFEASPDSFFKLLDQLFPIDMQSGSNLSLKLIYTATNAEEDRQYYRVSKLVVAYYQKHGIETKTFTSLKEAISNP